MSDTEKVYSQDTLEVLKRLCWIVWRLKYEDDEFLKDGKLKRNESVGTDCSENINFFFGQFDIHNQTLLANLINALPESKAKKELSEYVRELGTALIESMFN
jgi:hypothetical protein